jgi:two-component system sensor histidine kinase DegS
MTSDIKNTESDLKEDLKQEIQADREQTSNELKEISLMLEQSQLEVDRLAQKNAEINARLQQVHSHFNSVPRDEIRTAYNEALDSQQRLFVMRGQLEKLQGDYKHLEKYRKHLEKMSKVFDLVTPTKRQPGTSGDFSNIETIIKTQEAERQRLSRQMHDGPAQALSNFILQTEIAVRLFDIDQDKALEELAHLKEAATASFQQIRDFVFELRPMMLDDLGLLPTLKRYVEAFKEQTGSNVEFSVSGVERRLETFKEVIIFRAIQELMGFAIHQSKANTIKIQMDISDTLVKINMDDNGKGVDVDTVLESTGLGIKVIKERIEMLGGFFEIDSQPEKGCQVMIQVPAGVSGQAVFA